MSNETTKSKVVMPLRKATFTVEEKNKEKIFRPVNKRAHKWAKKVGKRTRLTLADIKTIKASKKVKVYAYDLTGTLKAVR
jgi:hypothetical protein